METGFMPDEITPHPPIRCERAGQGGRLVFDESAATNEELTIIGGLKSKTVDVVVCKEGVGPVLCVSVKGTGNAFRNLTNRMEEAIGDCTNLHVMYPGIVYGFLHLLKANRDGQPGVAKNDVCLQPDGTPVPSVIRYHDLLRDLAGRKFVRNDLTRYEAVALMLVDPQRGGAVLETFPAEDSPLQQARFFGELYRTYDMRYPFRNPKVRGLERAIWDSDSPAFNDIREAVGQDVQAGLGYVPREG